MGIFPHCLKKVLNNGTENEQAVCCHHVLELKLMLGNGFVVSSGTEFIENENEDVFKNDCETKAFKRLAEKLKKEYLRLNICVLADSLHKKHILGPAEKFWRTLCILVDKKFRLKNSLHFRTVFVT